MKEPADARRLGAPSLRAIEARYRALVESVEEVVYTLAADGTLASANRNWRRSLGLDPDSLRGSPFASLLHDADRARWGDAFRRCVEGTRPRISVRYRIANAAGCWVRQRATLTRLEPPDERPVAVLGVAVGIPGSSREPRPDGSAEPDPGIGALAGGIAHDIGNLLAPMLGYSRMVRQKAGDSPLVLELAELLDMNLPKLDRLARRLLVLGRDVEGDLRPVDLRRSVDEALRLVGPSLPAAIRLATRTAANVPPALGDPDRIHDVLVNLLLNAIDAMPAGGDLRLAVDRSGNRPTVTVADTGAGMDAETRARIFEPFFTTKGRGRGAGLGLAMVRRAVDAMGGNIDLTSAPGRGTIFRISFHEAPCESKAG